MLELAPAIHIQVRVGDILWDLALSHPFPSSPPFQVEHLMSCPPLLRARGVCFAPYSGDTRFGQCSNFRPALWAGGRTEMALKALVALVPALLLFSGSAVLLSRTRTVAVLLQLFGAA